jgi:hypothetical protein
LCSEGAGEEGGGSIDDDGSEGSKDTNVEEGAGFGVAEHADRLPAGVVPDDLVWMASYLAFTAQVLTYAEQWQLLLNVTDRTHNVFPAQLIAPADPHDPDSGPLAVVWSAADVRSANACGPAAFHVFVSLLCEVTWSHASACASSDVTRTLL